MTQRKLACIIGWPVSHSVSPAIHNAAFAALGLDWTYVPLAVRTGAITEGMSLLRLLGIEGANVTMPHKQAVVPLLDGLEGDAETLGAVNTIVHADGGFVGHNTDGAGFVGWLRAEANFEPAGKTALVLGAGGAARALALSLARADSTVMVAARRPEQARELEVLDPAIRSAEWGAPAEADLVVNATPVRRGLPLDTIALGPGVVAADLIYPPPLTDFVRVATDRGATAFDGLGMLVHQAALSFTLWTGREAPLDTMAAAARRAIETPDPAQAG